MVNVLHDSFLFFRSLWSCLPDTLYAFFVFVLIFLFVRLTFKLWGN